LRCAGLVTLVLKCHRLQSQDDFTRLMHPFNLVYKALGGAERAKLTGGIYHHRYGVRIYGGHATNAGDKCACLEISRADTNGIELSRNTAATDSDIIIARGEIGARVIAQGDVEVAGVAAERGITDGRVIVAVGVAKRAHNNRYPC
jgi:hypothetical protein